MRAPRALLVGLATLGLCAGVMPSAHADTTTDTYIVQLKSTVSASAVAPSLLGADAKVLGNIHTAIAKLTAAKAAALASNPNVTSIRKDFKVNASGQELNAPWNLSLLDNRTGSTDATYNYPNAGTGVTVYVIDSGLIPTHSEFASAHILPGVNFVQRTIVKPTKICGPGTAEDPTIDPADTVDQSGHGTAVTSLVVGAQNGVAKDANIVPVRMLDCDGEGDGQDYVAAVDWIVGNHVAGTPAVVNVSLGAIGSGLNDATKLLIADGITVVAAAGNDNVNACTQTPASTPAAITVAAVTPSLTEPVWPDGQSTNYGSCVDLYAPGDQVVVANWKVLTNGSSLAEGTSFSAPLTAGAAAQVLADHPTWTPDKVSKDLSDRAAYGVVKGARSVNKLVNVSPPPPPGMVTSLSPTRLMDTRIGLGAVGPLTSGRTVTIPVAGITAPSTVSAVLVNITCTDATGSGFITGHASGTGMPGVSNANFIAGKTGANLALIPVGSDGSIWLTAAVNGGTVQLVVDLQGFVSGGGAVTEPGAVVPVSPQRLADTRNTGAVGGGGTLNVNVAGGVAAGAAAVFLNVTVTLPGTPGFLTAYPAGEGRPSTSNLNFVPGQTVPNMVLVKVGAGGNVSIFNAASTAVHVIVDIQGFVTAGKAKVAGAIEPMSPVRVLDTRSGLGTAAGAVSSGSSRNIAFSGALGAASGVFMNLTVTNTTGSGYLSAYPANQGRPPVSNLNFDAGATVPNLAAVALNGSQCTLFAAVANGGSVQMVADVFAYIL